MNKIVKYVCIFIIIVGLYFLFSDVYSKEGYTTKASQYATAAEGGKVGITKAAVSTNKSMAGYGSNGIATKGYDGNGRAILAFDANNNPIVGYNGNSPILGTPAPAPATNIRQLSSVSNIIGFNSDGTPIYSYGTDANGNTITGYTLSGDPITQQLPPTQQPQTQQEQPQQPPTQQPPTQQPQSGPVQRFNF